jgi:hypothetical protein
MKKELDSLIIMIRKFQSLTAEKKDLVAREKLAREDLTAAAGAGPLDDPKIARQISAANATIDAVNARRGHVEKSLRPILGEMREALRAADTQWTRIIRAEGDRIAEKFYSLNAQFYEGNLREAKRHLNHELLPAWNLTNRSLWHGRAGDLTEENALATVNQFVNLIGANAARFNLSI